MAIIGLGYLGFLFFLFWLDNYLEKLDDRRYAERGQNS